MGLLQEKLAKSFFLNKCLKQGAKITKYVFSCSFSMKKYTLYSFRKL